MQQSLVTKDFQDLTDGLIAGKNDITFECLSTLFGEAADTSESVVDAWRRQGVLSQCAGDTR